MICQQLTKSKYSETELNDVLKNIYEDYASLRRSLIEYGFFTRDTFGKIYNKCVWWIDVKESQKDDIEIYIKEFL